MIAFKFNKEYEVIIDSEFYEIDITGGRGRGGSHFCTDYFLKLIITSKYFRGYFMRFVQSDIKKSLYQDFKDRIEEKEEEFGIKLMKWFHFNDNEMSITYTPNGNKIEARGFRKSSSSRTANMKSIAGATHIIIEEFEEVEEWDYRKLDDSLRTNKVDNLQILRIWNPPQKDHWILKTWYNLEPHTEYSDYFTYTPKGLEGHLCIFSTYMDNFDNINPKKRRRWEAYKENERTLDHYLTDIKGLVSAGAKGQIFKNWKLFKELPDDTYFYKVYGIDWGGNDPNTFMELNFDKKQKRVYIYERLYKPEILNSDFIKLVKEVNPENHEVVCDSARKDKRFEFSDAGINVFPSDKSKINDDFRKDIIDMVKEYDIFIFHLSENLIYEAQNFKWALDSATKEPLNKPEDKNNHAWDAIFYATRYYHMNYGYTYNDNEG